MAQDLERLVVSLEANIRKFENEMKRARQSTDTAMRGVERRTQQATRRLESIMTNASRHINTAIGGMLAGLSVQQVARFADAYTKVQNSLKVAGLEGESLKNTYSDLFAIAQRQAAPIEALATLYSRLSLAQKELNITAPELMRFTEGVATALRVSGQSAAEAQGALLQLSQALSGGKVQAEEYNSLIDGAQPVLKAVAAGLAEAGGSVSRLTALVKDGKVSSQAFFRAFEAGQHVLDDMAKDTVPTLSQGMERVYNALKDAAGKMDEAAGASRTFGDAINWLVGEIGKVPAGLQSTIDELQRLISLYERLAGWMSTVSQSSVPRSVNEDGSTAEPLVFKVSPQKKAQRRYTSAGTAAGAGRKPVSLADFPVDEGGGKGGGKSSRERQNELQREIEQIQERTRALDAERQTVGMSAGDAAKAEAAFRLLEAAKEANVAVTPQLKAQIETLAAAYGTATQKIEDARDAQDRVNEAMEDFRSTAQDAIGGFISDIRQGETAADALANSLDRVVDKLIDMSLNSLFDSKSGALGSLFSSLLGGGGLTMNPTGRAGGGNVYPGRAYTVGESGRETFVPTTPGRIIPHGKGAGGSPVQVNVINEAGVPTETRRNASGGVDVIIPLENALAERASRGKGALFKGMTARAGGNGLVG
ncbi:tape measure protein [Microvirga sp. GCM10011540]|uniref:tape measure protein n=1 Tax=Microvirga sp. GCM10011540 TaxID=3317338 RepID=UPI00361EAB82